jgi:hypothetical protein
MGTEVPKLKASLIPLGQGQRKQIKKSPLIAIWFLTSLGKWVCWGSNIKEVLL